MRYPWCRLVMWFNEYCGWTFRKCPRSVLGDILLARTSLHLSKFCFRKKILENIDFTFNKPSHLHCSHFVLLTCCLVEANRSVVLQTVRKVALEVNLKNEIPAEHSTIWVPLNSFSDCNFLVVILREVCGFFATGFVLPYISTVHHLWQGICYDIAWQIHLFLWYKII